MSAVLVTGATGNVGAAVIDQLLIRGVLVKAARRTGSTVGVPEGAAAVPFDFEDRTTFRDALDGVDRVFLMRPPHMSDAKSFTPFIEAMTDAGVAQVVFLSVQGAGQNVFVPHHGIERLLKRSSLAWTLLRPSFFMQNLTTTHLADIRDRNEIFVPAGRGRTNFIDVADIAEVAAICLTAPGHTGAAYEITGSEALSYEEVATVLSSVCKRDIRYPRPSASDFKAQMRRRGYDGEFVNVMASIYAVARFGMAAGTTDTFERITGHRPRTLAEWAQDNAECWAPQDAVDP